MTIKHKLSVFTFSLCLALSASFSECASPKDDKRKKEISSLQALSKDRKDKIQALNVQITQLKLANSILQQNAKAERDRGILFGGMATNAAFCITVLVLKLFGV